MMSLELWAGPECTVNRVGDHVHDQLRETGFERRLDDLDRLAGLGVARIRMPLLWERAVGHGGMFDWQWSDTRIARLQALGLPCVAGLLHHGSGPRGTDLLDAAFPAALARYAGAVAQRYPHLDAYTPVNEPLTTARFSCLYGLWYPHHRDDRSMVRALLVQVRATVLAMRAIRAVQPAARLVQTDDLGYTHAVPSLQYQADFENERRWLAFDLLAGRVDAHHPMWSYLRQHGAQEAELMDLVALPCTPDIVGVNYYVTSERFLDDRLGHYPAHLHGGNAQHRYVDVEAVRVRGTQPGGFARRLDEAWQRYRQPVALTEVHIGCTREEQLRWLSQAWSAAQEARQRGADVRAVTAWSAFGAMDWNSLVTRRTGHYEPGLWDARSDPPRPTALARLAGHLAQGRPMQHPALQGPGWWQRESRCLFPINDATPPRLASVALVQGPPLLIMGDGGRVGHTFARLCEARGLPHRLLDRDELDILDPASVHAALERWCPWAVINTAGFAHIHCPQSEPHLLGGGAAATTVLARACHERGVRVVTFSSDLVFDGEKCQSYVESDPLAPLDACGRAQAEAESTVLSLDRTALVIRTAVPFCPRHTGHFIASGLRSLREGNVWHAVADQLVSPTYVPDMASATLDLLLDEESGVWHLANQGKASWFDFATLAARAAGLADARVAPVQTDKAAAVSRPSCLASERGLIMPTLENALARYAQEALVDWQVQRS